MKKVVLITGATSAIAIACARVWAAEGAQLILLGRNAERLQLTEADLLARGASGVHSHLMDIADLDAQQKAFDWIRQLQLPINVCLVATGVLPDQLQCERDPSSAVTQFHTNAVAVIAWVSRLAHWMLLQQPATIAVITSVAGDRGRPSNYHYGSAKAAVSTFCAGLHAQTGRRGLRILDIKPGFVATPMTAGLSLPPRLVATPERVARDITTAIGGGRQVCYTPGFWRYIMWVIRWIPAAVFNRLSL